MKRALKVLVLLAALTIPAAGGQDSPGADGTLEINYVFGKADGIEPSYQIAVWLEDEKGAYVQSLLLSEYLAYGGFNDETICPDWSKVAAWDKATETEYDAVSRPTPPLGAQTLKIDCKERGIRPGTYRYCVEVHLVEAFNILYRGTITIGNLPAEDTASVSYLPSKHDASDNVINAVSARYTPATAETTEERKPQ